MTAIVTGGAGGLGVSTARAIAARGISIGIVDIGQERSAEVALKIATDYGVATAAVDADLADRDAVTAAWRSIEDEIGEVDVLVNSAGTFRPRTALEITPDNWDFALRTNLTGPFFASQHAIGLWTERSVAGSIVNVASTAAYASSFHEATDYGAAKAGLIGLTTHLAVKFGEQGIRVNSIVPHSFKSPMNADRLTDPAEVAKSVAQVPLARVAEVEEIASAIVYLAYDATYVTGTALRVDGGTLSTM